jgi:hypothetical protein
MTLEIMDLIVTQNIKILSINDSRFKN